MRPVLVAASPKLIRGKSRMTHEVSNLRTTDDQSALTRGRSMRGGHVKGKRGSMGRTPVNEGPWWDVRLHSGHQEYVSLEELEAASEWLDALMDSKHSQPTTPDGLPTPPSGQGNATCQKFRQFRQKCSSVLTRLSSRLGLRGWALRQP